MNEIEGPIELARSLKQKGASLSTARRAPRSETWYTLRMADHDVSPKRKSHLMKRVLIGSALVLLVVLVVTGIHEEYANFAKDWISSGATLIGGCCEVGPAHIAELKRKFG